MKTTYINNDGIKCGFIVSNCGRWVDCFKGNENNIINSFFTFGRGTTHRQNNTPQFTKNEIVLQQRFGILFRGQNLIVNECDKLNLSKFDLDCYIKLKYHNTFLSFLTSNLTKNKEKTIELYTQLLEM